MAKKSEFPKAIYRGIIPIGEIEISCVVLDDETRLVSKASIFKAFGRKKRGLSKERQAKAIIDVPEGVIKLPPFIAADNLKSLLDNDLAAVIKPIQYIDGEAMESGYDATILPKLCNLYLKARREKILTASQQIMASRAEILLSAFAKVGIIALIDEATGYQTNRKADALRILVESYIREDARKWTKEFSDEFFAALDEIYGNKKTTSRSRPLYYGKFINMYIYDPIEQGIVLRELKILQNIEKNKRLHQFLNNERGLKVLHERMNKIIALLQTSNSIESFKRKFEIMESKQKWFDFDDMN